MLSPFVLKYKRSRGRVSPFTLERISFNKANLRGLIEDNLRFEVKKFVSFISEDDLIYSYIGRVEYPFVISSGFICDATELFGRDSESVVPPRCNMFCFIWRANPEIEVEKSLVVSKEEEIS
jgi:hypothetical protein